MTVIQIYYDLSPLKSIYFNFECEQQFKFLGDIISNINNLNINANNRLLMDYECFYEIRNKRKSKFIDAGIKIDLYKKICVLIDVYGSPLNKSEKSQFITGECNYLWIWDFLFIDLPIVYIFSNIEL